METVRRHLRTKGDIVAALSAALIAVLAYSAVGAYLLR
jgi:hypothetical protein